MTWNRKCDGCRKPLTLEDDRDSLQWDGRVLCRACRVVDAEQYEEGPTCSICDGLGHGYPGGGPCPLEDRGGYDNEPRWAQ